MKAAVVGWKMVYRLSDYYIQTDDGIKYHYPILQHTTMI